MTVRVAAIQCDIVWEDRAATLDRLHPLVASAVAAGARLIVLPEMFAVGFSMRTDVISEPETDGPTASWLRAAAHEHDVSIGGSVPTRVSGGGVRNRFLLARPDGRLDRYDKIKPFTFSGEDRHYEAGSEPTGWEVDGLRVTPFVCYDLRFADLWWRRAADTDLYLCVASWPEARRAHWRTLLVARAVENQAWVLGCNRVGSGGDVDYAGDSMVVDPLGEVVASAARAETVVVADVDPGRVAAVRARYPFLDDR